MVDEATRRAAACGTVAGVCAGARACSFDYYYINAIVCVCVCVCVCVPIPFSLALSLSVRFDVTCCSECVLC